jgi:hypothetical protein
VASIHSSLVSVMKKKQAQNRGEQAPEHRPHRVRLPGFLIENTEIGLGDLIKKATYAIGIKPCGGCEKRAAALNRWMTFSR